MLLHFSVLTDLKVFVKYPHNVTLFVPPLIFFSTAMTHAGSPS